MLALTDQESGDDLCRDVFASRMGYVPYIMPGFALARKAREVFEADPDVEGLILLKHGIFTFGETAREAYDRMIEMVNLAEETIAARRTGSMVTVKWPGKIAPVATIAPILRGLCAEQIGDDYRRMVMDFRTGDAIRAFVDGEQLARYSQQGTVTPDHVIRTKPKPLIVPPPQADALDAFRDVADLALGP